MLDVQDCSLVVVDVQGRLAELMYEKDLLFKNIQILIKAAKLLSIPILWTQQKPEAIGVTIPQISELLTDNEPINKACFSCCGLKEFNDKINALVRKEVLLCGIEAHVCIYQTAIELIASGKEVHVIADAVSSRTSGNKAIAIQRMSAEGAKISSTEMALFELLKTAEHPQFKEIIKLVK
jgi:nicotinamidase-related amidase